MIYSLIDDTNNKTCLNNFALLQLTMLQHYQD